MSIITKILELLGMKKEESIESITSPMVKIVTKLENYAVKKSQQAEADEQRARALKAKAEQEIACAIDARALADRYSTLTSSVPAE